MQQPSAYDRQGGSHILGVIILALFVFLIAVIAITTVGLFQTEDAPPQGDTPPSQQQDPPQGEGQEPDPSTPPTTEPEPQTPPQTEPTTPSEPAVPADSYRLQTVSGITQEMSHRTQDPEVGIYSANAVIADVSTKTVLAGYGADALMFPASMTKVMTLLVACERLKKSDYDVKVTMSDSIIAEMQRQNASGFGFAAGDVVTVRDLLYAVALESDCAASVQLAEYVAGSHAAFVDMMNEKCAAMKLTSTHFTNATGLHDLNHYTTCREMASIMAAAVDNADVLALLSEDVYETYITFRGSPNTRVTFYSTYFWDVVVHGAGNFYQLPAGARVLAAKTGSTDEAGNCLVSCVRSTNGKNYVIVTGGAGSATLYCADLVDIYNTYVK